MGGGAARQFAAIIESFIPFGVFLSLLFADS